MITPREDGPFRREPERGLRIVRIANFVTPVSGGLRTALRHLGEGYAAAGHEPVLVVPGATASDELTPQGRVISLPGPEIPGSGGYRVLGRRAPVEAALESLEPDRLEVSDRTTLRWTGEWARRHRVPAVMVSHESADGVLGTWGLPAGVCPRAPPAAPPTPSTAVRRSPTPRWCAPRPGPPPSSSGSAPATSSAPRSVWTSRAGTRPPTTPRCANGTGWAPRCCW